MNDWPDMTDVVTHDLSDKQLKALVVLLSASSIGEAAQEAGVSRRTLQRRLHNDASFRTAYKYKRQVAMDNMIGLLQATSFRAIEVLGASLNSRNESARLRAALGVLEYALKGVELDITDRLEKIEAELRENGSLNDW